MAPRITWLLDISIIGSNIVRRCHSRRCYVALAIFKWNWQTSTTLAADRIYRSASCINWSTLELSEWANHMLGFSVTLSMTNWHFILMHIVWSLQRQSRESFTDAADGWRELWHRRGNGRKWFCRSLCQCPTKVMTDLHQIFFLLWKIKIYSQTFHIFEQTKKFDPNDSMMCVQCWISLNTI